MSEHRFSDELIKMAEDAAFYFRRFIIHKNELERHGCIVKFICDKQTGAYADITIEALVTLVHPQLAP